MIELKPPELHGPDVARRERPRSESRDGNNHVGVPVGVWVRCEECKDILFRQDVERNLSVCPGCDHHFQMTARQRIDQLLDPETFEEWSIELRPTDPLGFVDRVSYPDRVRSEQARLGMREAAIIGWGLIRGVPLVLGVLDPRFILGSMGSVVGEKLTRGVEESIRRRLPLVIVASSGGGARMHEGAYSLMQMAKVSSALARHRQSGGFFISVLTNPTMAGVTASFASLGDVLLAEPAAQIGFAGPWLISQVSHAPFPNGFQTSESLLEHGLIDQVVHRRDLVDVIADLLEYTMI